jgi:hypothetical protein
MSFLMKRWGKKVRHRSFFMKRRSKKVRHIGSFHDKLWLNGPKPDIFNETPEQKSTASELFYEMQEKNCPVPGFWDYLGGMHSRGGYIWME